MKRKCSIEDCDGFAHAKGWCIHHYGLHYRHGSPYHVSGRRRAYRQGGLLERLSHYTLVSEGCWEWTGPTNEQGYGIVTYENVQRVAHRAWYSILRGPIPKRLTLDHLCRERLCMNPWHLEPVTNAENVRRSHHCFPCHCVDGIGESPSFPAVEDDLHFATVVSSQDSLLDMEDYADHTEQQWFKRKAE